MREAELEQLKALSHDEVCAFYRKMVIEEPHLALFKTYSDKYLEDIEFGQLDEAARGNKLPAMPTLTVHLSS